MQLLDLPYEVRYMIYKKTWTKNQLGGTDMEWVCEALELKYNDWLDWSKHYHFPRRRATVWNAEGSHKRDLEDLGLLQNLN